MVKLYYRLRKPNKLKKKGIKYMSNLWERFENIVSADEVSDAKSQFEPLAVGDYNAILMEIEPSESKGGLPMLKGKFKTLEGNKTIFYNQMLQNVSMPHMTAVNIAEAVTFLGGVIGEEITFTGLGALATLVEGIDVGGEYIVNISYGTKDFDMKFPKLKIVEIVTEGKPLDTTLIDDSDIPF